MNFSLIFVEMSLVKIFYFAAAIIILAIKIGQNGCDGFKVIETGVGAVRGVKETTFWKRVDYYSFKGIPYAKKPIGKHRFKVNTPFSISYELPFINFCLNVEIQAPKPIEPWKPSILDAFKFGNKCIQLGLISFDSYFESEDCLFLNIYIPGEINTVIMSAKMNECVSINFDYLF